jgi:hypothetical protein
MDKLFRGMLKNVIGTSYLLDSFSYKGKFDEAAIGDLIWLLIRLNLITNAIKYSQCIYKQIYNLAYFSYTIKNSI